MPCWACLSCVPYSIEQSFELQLLVVSAGQGTPEEPVVTDDYFRLIRHGNPETMNADALKAEVSRLVAQERVQYGRIQANSNIKKLTEAMWKGWQKEQNALLGR
jgi:hypothetical protein